MQDITNLMTMLSPNLRHDVTQQMFLSVLNKISVFSKNHEIIEYVLANIEAH